MFLAALVGTGIAAPAAAQMLPCAPRGVVLHELKQQFGEVPAGRGLASAGAILELLVSPTGTWTILTSLPSGLSCLSAAGEFWESIAQPSETGSALPRGKAAALERLGR